MKNPRQAARSLTASMLLAASNAAMPASEWLPTEDDYFATIPTVTSAARLEKSRLELGMSVTVIDREMIEASPATTIPDLLRLVPGFQVAHATGSVFAPGYHGVSDQWPRRMEVMVDGRSVYLNTIAAVEWSALGIAIEDIERIEVVRGPNAPTFGSNAVFGSINIVSRAPFLMTGKFLRGTFGSKDTNNAVARWAGKLGGWESSLTAQYRSDEGFDNVDDRMRLGDLRFRGDYQVGATDSLSVQLGLTDGELGADGVAGDVWNKPRDRDVRSHHQQLTWSRQGADGGGYGVNFSHNYFDQEDSYSVDISNSPTYLPPPYPSAYPTGSSATHGFYEATSERYDLEFQHTLKPGDDWRLAWGFGGRYDRVSSDLLLGDISEVDSYSGRLFGSFEWKPTDRLSFSLDALTEAHEAYGSNTSPRVGLNWLASDTRSFRASASRSYRVYSLLSRYIDHSIYPDPPIIPGLGFPLTKSRSPDDFTPEKVTAYEVGYMEQWRDLGLSLDVRLFHERLDDSGVGLESPGPAIWRDAGGGWNTKGVDVQLDYRPTPATRLTGAYSWAKSDGKLATEADSDGDISRYESLDDATPLNTLSLLLSHRLNPQWSGSLALYHMDEVRWRGEGSEVDGYTRLDLKLAREFAMKGSQAEVALIVHNLTGEDYNEFRVPSTYGREGNVFDRRAYVQLSIQLD